VSKTGVKISEDVKSTAIPAASNYKGFVGGVFSGIAKLSVGHPFDTIKVRLQTSTSTQFAGPLDCLLKTVRNEGFLGVYKGASPPLVGWMVLSLLSSEPLLVLMDFTVHGLSHARLTHSLPPPPQRTHLQPRIDCPRTP
jgi:hypothetical protein